MKFIGLLLTLAAVIGFAIFVLNSPSGQEPGEGIRGLPPAQEPGDLEITEWLARNIIASVRGSQSDSSGATYTAVNLGKEELPVLIIGTAEPLADFSGRQSRATIVVVRVLNETGEYEEIGRVQYEELLRGAPELNELQDITGDGTKELFMSLGYGGASNAAYGFLRVDTEGKTVTWVQLRDHAGQVRDAMFLIGGTVTHTETVQAFDLNFDGKKEIVELFTQIWEPSGQESGIPSKQARLPDGQAGETWCLARAYQWSGSFLDFDRALSEQFLASLGPDCAI